MTGVLKMPRLPTILVLPAKGEIRERHGNRADAASEINRPQRRTADVGVEGVKRVAHRRDVHDVVSSLHHDDVGDVERLGVDSVVYGQFEHESERGRTDVGCAESSLGEVRAGKTRVVTALQDRLLGKCRHVERN